MWCIYFRQNYKKWERKSFDRSFHFSGEIPDGGKFKYRGHTLYEGRREWEEFECFLSFEDNFNVVVEAKHRWFPEQSEGKIIENKKIFIEGIKEREGFTMYLTSLKGSSNPGFAGFFEKFDQNFVLLPQESSYEITKLFPKTISKLMRFYFVVILLLSISCVIIFSMNQMKYVYSCDDSNYILSYPWGAFMSFLGLVAIFAYSNPFGLRCVRDEPYCSTIAFFFLFFLGLSLLCLIFSSYDFTLADLLHSNTLIDTRGNYIIDHSNEIQNTCQFDKYECSIVYSANYTLRTDECKDSFDLKCFSFDSMKGSCSNGLNAFYASMIFQGFFELFLSFLWCVFIVKCLTMEFFTMDQWNLIFMRLEQWNKKEKPGLQNKNNQIEVCGNLTVE